MIRKLVVSALAALILGLAGIGLGPQTASAEVLLNMFFVVSAVPNENACEAGFSKITLSGTAHHVWYRTPDNTLKRNIQVHLTGTDSDGTEYVFNAQRKMEHFAYFDPLAPGNLFPFDDRFTANLISKGPTVNAQRVTTFTMSYSLNPAGNPNAVTVLACRG